MLPSMSTTLMQIVKKALLVVMGIGYIAAGWNHFRDPNFYLPMMPPYLPWHLPLIYASGVFEMLLGAMVLLPWTRRLGALGLVLLLIAIAPANLHMALHNIPPPGVGPLPPYALWLRLAFQPVLIAWAAWYLPREAAR